MNRDRQGYEWGIYDTIISMATASAAAMGGYIAQQFSFRLLFIGVGCMSILGSFFIVRIFKEEFTRDKTKKHKPVALHRSHHGVHRVR
jgi:predicted MFS family arabinose efflux permease